MFYLTIRVFEENWLYMKRPIDHFYIIFLGLYTSLVISSNLIFQKFLSVNIFDYFEFTISAGLLVFPATFLISDIISEIYGKKAALLMAWSGFIGFVAVIGLIQITIFFPATNWSPISDLEFKKIFSVVDIAYLASFLSSLISQFISINIFHSLSRNTKEKHLWLRNNASTIISQLFDTIVVISILVYFKIISSEVMVALFVNSYLYKLLFAVLDTPFVYLFVFLLNGFKSNKSYGTRFGNYNT